MRETLNTNKYLVKEGKEISLKDFATSHNGTKFTKEQLEIMLQNSTGQLAALQDKLYASDKYSMLVVLQAMDAAGKDSTVKHLMSGFNPSGVKVCNFKEPSSTELDHDFFWRHYKELPRRGEIGIFNRSHYENVLITRIHPELILKENLPGIESVEDITKKFWKARFEQINRFEKNLADNGTVILKLFLHVSKEEQKKRFLERIENPKKNWKFSVSDISERDHWDEYQKAYEDAINNTSTEYAPWYIIPADDKSYLRLAAGLIMYNTFEKLQLSYPKLSKAGKVELQKAKEKLMNEK